ncbi:hypothetical protein SAMN05444000_101163 [Shimia gijangensis]|uniref:Cytochrome C and Quinol oxidase polypeptide I n=1 Tax=Shimia gijangensis TaxID=1470563 RepID=A0A1M6B9E6_9RHOB|nr:hypothetical protein [Shimia gijangensis]SHI45360.1 hypothetical protein SAMN05444000_101163 [Shimia gijangensis]
MRGISKAFFGLALVCAIVGMAWGIQMSASGDHLLSPAHAHLNLIGYVGFAIFGIYYHLVPSAAEKMIAKIHLAIAVVGVVLMVPGIVMAIRETSETLAKLGSIAAIASMLLFAWIFITSSRET